MQAVQKVFQSVLNAKSHSAPEKIRPGARLHHRTSRAVQDSIPGTGFPDPGPVDCLPAIAWEGGAYHLQPANGGGQMRSAHPGINPEIEAGADAVTRSFGTKDDLHPRTCPADAGWRSELRELLEPRRRRGDRAPATG